jgi:hypothetical protein
VSPTVDLIRQKRDALASKREQLMANINVLAGAISICDELLQEISATALTTATEQAAQDNSEGTTDRPPARTKRKAAR